MHLKDDPLLTLRNAVENASNGPVTDSEIVAILRGVGGTLPQRQALFGDASLQALARAGAVCGVALPTILAAYGAAKSTAAAANPELDRALLGDW